MPDRKTKRLHRHKHVMESENRGNIVRSCLLIIQQREEEKKGDLSEKVKIITNR